MILESVEADISFYVSRNNNENRIKCSGFFSSILSKTYCPCLKHTLLEMLESLGFVGLVLVFRAGGFCIFVVVCFVVYFVLFFPF